MVLLEGRVQVAQDAFHHWILQEARPEPSARFHPGVGIPAVEIAVKGKIGI